jgi:DNA-binding response OmpR family regulator
MASILLIDNDSHFRKATVAALQSRRHNVAEAARGSAADAILATRKFDLIIVDGRLSDLDGVAWLERLRSVDRRSPVMYVAPDAEPDPRLHRLGVARVEKPIEADELAERAQHVLQ